MTILTGPTDQQQAFIRDELDQLTATLDPAHARAFIDGALWAVHDQLGLHAAAVALDAPDGVTYVATVVRLRAALDALETAREVHS